MGAAEWGTLRAGKAFGFRDGSWDHKIGDEAAGGDASERRLPKRATWPVHVHIKAVFSRRLRWVYGFLVPRVRCVPPVPPWLPVFWIYTSILRFTCYKHFFLKGESFTSHQESLVGALDTRSKQT